MSWPLVRPVSHSCVDSFGATKKSAIFRGNVHQACGCDRGQMLGMLLVHSTGLWCNGETCFGSACSVDMLLDESTAASLGTAPSCSWKDETTVTVTFGRGERGMCTLGTPFYFCRTRRARSAWTPCDSHVHSTPSWLGSIFTANLIPGKTTVTCRHSHDSKYAASALTRSSASANQF